MQQMNEVTRYFRWHQNFCLMLSAPALGLYTCIKLWKKCLKSDERDFLKLATNDRSDKMFLLTSKFCSQGVVSPCPGLYTCIKSWKKLYKIRLQRDIFETCSKWPKWQEVSVDIKILSPGVVCLWPAAIYFSNDDPGLTLTIFLTGSDLFLMLLYGWQLVEHWLLLYCQVCSNSAYPQHSGERYRTNGPLVVIMKQNLFF